MNLIIAASSGGITDIVRDTAEAFGWNWKLFLSQVISFCIVAYLLQRFAYKPILAVLEERRRKIEEGQINHFRLSLTAQHATPKGTPPKGAETFNVGGCLKDCQ